MIVVCDCDISLNVRGWGYFCGCG